MNSLSIQKTISTPSVQFNSEKNTLSFIGRSYPENARAFYIPILAWVNENKDSFASNFIFELNLEYYNTASSKFILEIMHILEKTASVGQIQISIRWLYLEHDEDMRDAGEEYRQFIKLPFDLIPLPVS